MSRKTQRYTDWKDAAARHIYTCNILKLYLDDISKPKTLDSCAKNMYYLVGYIIECSINYAIYGYIDYKGDDIKELTINKNVCNVTYAFTKGKDNTAALEKHKGEVVFQIVHHEIQKNIKFFEKNSIQQEYLENFASELEKDVKLKEIFDNWNPEIRYFCPIEIDIPTLIKFFELSKKVNIACLNITD
jgi:hypothetical protein